MMTLGLSQYLRDPLFLSEGDSASYKDLYEIPEASQEASNTI